MVIIFLVVVEVVVGVVVAVIVAVETIDGIAGSSVDIEWQWTRRWFFVEQTDWRPLQEYVRRLKLIEIGG